MTVRGPGPAAAPSAAQLLQRYRRRAQLTQAELADQSGYSANYISKLERDQRSLPAAVIERMAVVLGLSAVEVEELKAARARSGPARTHADRSPLAGRGDEQALLRDHLAGLGPPVLLFAGEPGIGKTRLLEEAASLAEERGLAVLAGRCQRRAQDPYDPLTDALAHSIVELPEPARAAVVREAPWLQLLLPELTPLARLGAAGRDQMLAASVELQPRQQRRLLLAAVSDYLQRVAGRAGTLLLLDDLQWAGPDALDVLVALLSASPTAPVRLIGAYRDNEAPSEAALRGVVADLARADLVQVHPLGPLAEPDAEALLASLLVDDELRVHVPAVARRAAGVPLFLISYAEVLRRREHLDASPLELPWNVAQVIRQRLLALPEAVRELLGAAAVIGQVVPPGLLGQVTGLAEDEALTGLETAAAARLLDEDEDAAYRFRHELIRETIEADLSAGRRQLLHRRVGDVLEQDAAAPLESLAFHFELSDAHERALFYLERAGTEAQQRCAHAAAVAYFRRAIARSAQLGRGIDTALLHEKLGSALYMAGMYAEAIEVLERAIDLYHLQGDDDGVRRAVGALAKAHVRQGTDHKIVDRVMALVENDPLGRASSRSRGSVALREALLRVIFGKGSYQQLLAAGRSLARVGRATRSRRLLNMGRRTEGVALIFLGRLPEGAAVLERALQPAPAADERERVAEMALVLSGAYLVMGALEQSEGLSRRMLPLAAAASDPVTIAGHTLLLGVALHLRGDWHDADTYLARADELLAAAGPSSMAVRLAGARAPCLIWGGALEQARDYLERTLHLAGSMRVAPSDRSVLALLAELDVLEGRPEVAVARLAPFAQAGLSWHDAVLLPSTLASAYLALDELTLAEPLAARAVLAAQRMGAWTVGIGALRVQALIAARQGHEERARRALEDGLRRARAVPFRHGEARLLEAFALLERQRGDEHAAQARLAEALAIYSALGASRDVERLRE